MDGLVIKSSTSVRERLSSITRNWFLMEPLYFSVFCTHALSAEQNLSIPMRTGGGKVQYNPSLLEPMTDQEIEEYLKVEMIRILLKHPYQRQPYGALPELLYLASNATIYDGMSNCFHIPLIPEDIIKKIPRHRTFEEYYEWLRRQFPSQKNTDVSETAASTGTAADAASRGIASVAGIVDVAVEATRLWQEDSLMEQSINSVISYSSVRGTIPGWMMDIIKASIIPPVNVSNLLKRFKQTCISQHRNLTRLRPSRRYGFEQMGSRFAYTTRILVAIDTSGSVGSEMLSRMLGLVNRIFKQGILHIDVLQFDADLQLPLIPINKAINHCTIKGRGGTDFQPVADFYMDHNEYDGLIFITDGDAPLPMVSACDIFRPVEWIIVDDTNVPKIEHGWKRLKAINN